MDMFYVDFTSNLLGSSRDKKKRMQMFRRVPKSRMNLSVGGFSYLEISIPAKEWAY